MLKNISKLNGVQQLSKKEQKNIVGGLMMAYSCDKNECPQGYRCCKDACKAITRSCIQ
jgi:hypothetical protein